MSYWAQMMRIIDLITAWGVLSSLLGRSWITGSFEDPDVKLLKAEAVKTCLLEREFVMRLRIDNPNNFGLPVRGLRYAV